GSGFPALWRHENLNGETHEWLKEEFASVPLTFFTQMTRCVENGSLVSVDEAGRLPADLAAGPPRTDARIALFAGERNLCFLPVSKEHTFRYFKRTSKQPCSLTILPSYGHLDVFLGRDAARDTFPLLFAALES